jgi:hypothetical protein
MAASSHDDRVVIRRSGAKPVRAHADLASAVALVVERERTMTQTIQERWNATFAKLDRSCPARRADEGDIAFMRRLARIGRKYIPRGEQMARVDFDALPANVVEQFRELMRECVEKNLYHTANMKPGDLRQVIQVDQNTGAKTRCFVGPTSFVREMGQPCRRVTRICAPAGTTLFSADRGGMRGLF